MPILALKFPLDSLLERILMRFSILTLDPSGFCLEADCDFLELFPRGWRARLVEGLEQARGIEVHAMAVRDGTRVHTAVFWCVGETTVLFWLPGHVETGADAAA